MKALRLVAEIEDKVYIPLHASLADLLLTNLISNAIRHNEGTGVILVRLRREGLVIANTGREPQVPTEELFERFKKGNPGSDSIGIGLAIVRQICDMSHFDIIYEYRDGFHILAISFLPRQAASKLLQNLSLSLR
jgi:signal transduction histidine kinase